MTLSQSLPREANLNITAHLGGTVSTAKPLY